MTIELTVEGMTCEGCEEIVESAIEDVGGVDHAEADRHDDHATVEGDPDVDALLDAVDMAGYGATVES